MAQLQRDFGERVKQLRLDRGWTQAELSERLGWHQPSLCDLEKGRHAATLDTVEKVASVLGVNPGELIGRTPTHNI